MRWLTPSMSHGYKKHSILYNACVAGARACTCSCGGSHGVWFVGGGSWEVLLWSWEFVPVPLGLPVHTTEHRASLHPPALRRTARLGLTSCHVLCLCCSFTAHHASPACMHASAHHEPMQEAGNPFAYPHASQRVVSAAVDPGMCAGASGAAGVHSKSCRKHSR